MAPPCSAWKGLPQSHRCLRAPLRARPRPPRPPVRPMPIYEYRCPDCGHQFDALQKISDDPIPLTSSLSPAGAPLSLAGTFPTTA